jgi:hypothetical protein
MNFNLDGLEAFGSHKSSARQEWRPPRVEDLSFDIVIAFDQTLSATAGMCAHREGEGFAVRGVEMISGTSEATGNEGNLQKGVDLCRKFDFFLRKMQSHHPDEPITVVHEAPPIGGGVIRHPESALLAAQVLRIACSGLGIPVAPMVTSSTHKKAVCGNGQATKAEAHQGLTLLADSWPISGFRQVSNGDKRDALCVAIAHLLREGAK